MSHMPYEDNEQPRRGKEDEGPRRDVAGGRTPHSAEGGALDEEEERRVPQGEPGKTPGSAEGEDEPHRHASSNPPY